MCSSETIICFGVAIRSWQLIVAAEAFVNFSPVLKAIDSIILRQRNGSLRVKGKLQGKINISNMPLEVLEMLRSKVFDEGELFKAAQSLVSLEDEDNSGSRDWRSIPLPHGQVTGGCACWDEHFEMLNDINFYYAGIRKPVVSLIQLVEKA